MINFSNLLSKFPSIPNPCSDGFKNQCAIRMCIALAGVDPTFLNSFPGNRCSHGHARSASRLANYLRSRLGEPIIKTSRSQIGSGRGINEGQGIIFYLREPNMNHIDLWTTRMSLPRYGPGNVRTMSWTTIDAREYWFWPLLP